MELHLKQLSAIERVEFDLEVLYQQQLEMRRLTHQEDTLLIRMHSRYQEKPYSSTALFFLTVTHPFRKLVITLVLNAKFDSLILTAIVLNCFLLAIDDYTSGAWKSVLDTVLIFVFASESVLKIVAQGFLLGKNAYLRDAWNVLDFFVVCTGLYGFFTGGGNVSVLRTIRILRPLRTINSIPEMKVLTISILTSIPMLVDIFVLILMFIYIFALAGGQLYGGQFSYVCFDINGSANYQQICAFDPTCAEFNVNCGNTGCDVNQYCWNSFKNPYQGLISFDNTLLSVLTIYTALTLEGWTDTMRFARAALNQKFLSDIYFYVLIVIGSFFLMQLTVAAIYVKFSENFRKQKKAIQFIEERQPEQEYRPIRPEAPPASYRMKWFRFRLNMHEQINTVWFAWFTTGIIVINTGIMASEYYGMTDTHQQFNADMNVVLNVCFAIEMAMKMFGLGIKGYVSDQMNIFDGVVVLLGMIEIILAGQANLKGLLVLRAFRLLRVFKLARRWKTLRIMLVKLLRSVKAIGYLGLLMAIIIFIYTLLGKQLFQNKMDDGSGNTPELNFDSVYWSFVAVFTVLTTQNWNSTMSNAVGPTNMAYSLYFISLIIIGTNILLNLFLAILIHQFEVEELERSEIDLEENATEGNQEIGPEQVNIKPRKRRRRSRKTGIKDMNVKKEEDVEVEVIKLNGRSFCIFSKKNPIRKIMRSLLLNPYFDSFVYSLISFSCLLLAIDEPNKSKFTTDFLYLSNFVVLGLFTAEMIIKAIVFGFLLGPDAYIRNSWNILDFFIIFISYLDFFLSTFVGSQINLSFLRVLRALRALRPLRMISQDEKMKKIVASVLRTIPALVNVMMITLLFYLIFGILGVIFFKGGLYFCNDPNITYQQDCVGAFIDTNGNVLYRNWRTLPYHYDNILNAMLNLFAVSVNGDWTDYMLAVVNITGPGQQMIKDYNQAAALFYIVFIFVVNFFIMNLYLGAIVTNFNEIQREIDGSLFLSDSQKNWVQTQRLLLRTSPRVRFIRPKNAFQAFFYDFVMNYKFDRMIQTSIVLNVIFMGLAEFPGDTNLNSFLDISNMVFVIVFCCEMGCKMIGQGFHYYIMDKWNQFDCAVTLLSVISIVPAGYSSATVFKSFRIARLFRLAKLYKGFQHIMQLAIIAAPSLLNIGTLLVLLWFIYSVAGMYLFGKLDYSNSNPYILDDQINFTTFYNSFALIFQCLTGENWDLIMHDCMGLPDCQGGSDACGNIGFGLVYHITYQIIGVNFFLNMFIAVILENFNEADMDVTLAGVSPKDLRRFEKAWSLYAPTGSYRIPVKFLPPLLTSVELPLGFKGQGLNKTQVLRIIAALGIKQKQREAYFGDVLWSLCESVAGTNLEQAKSFEAVKSILKAIESRFPVVNVMDKRQAYYREEISAGKMLAGKIIWKAWRKYREEREWGRGEREMEEDS
jgi:hypothetical protein